MLEASPRAAGPDTAEDLLASALVVSFSSRAHAVPATLTVSRLLTENSSGRRSSSPRSRPTLHLRLVQDEDHDVKQYKYLHRRA